MPDQEPPLWNLYSYFLNVPVFETSDDFLNKNDFVSDGFVSLNLQKHIMMILVINKTMSFYWKFWVQYSTRKEKGFPMKHYSLT